MRSLVSVESCVLWVIVRTHRPIMTITIGFLSLMVSAGPCIGQNNSTNMDCKPTPTNNLRIEGLSGFPTDWPETLWLPSGTEIERIIMTGNMATIELSKETLQGLDDAKLTCLFNEIRKLFYNVPAIQSIRLNYQGKRLSSFIPPAPDVSPKRVPGEISAESISVPSGTVLTGLSGTSITIGPSHGRLWNGTGWGWQRGDECGFGDDGREDTNSILLMQYLYQYLSQDGATVHVPRQLDQTDCCNSAENYPWWKLAAYSWLYHQGLPCTVWASNTASCSSDMGPNRTNDDIRARPLYADYVNSDIYISHHTNAYNGAASGTITFRDTAMEHPAHEANSLLLAQKIQTNVVNVIKNVYGISDWYDRGVADSNGGFGEIRIPNRPACLIELAFHDYCTRDALYLKDPFFRSLTQWSIYQGVCEYFGRTPTWAMYSCEYVSDTIPSQMEVGQTYNVSITFRNRGVLWSSARSFKLGAVDNSDPFTTTTRVDVSGEIRPGGTFTFNLTMKAPSTTGQYITDWQMTRENISWFGPIHRETVSVGTGPFPPTINLHPTSQTVAAGQTATFTVDASGTAPLSYQWQKNGTDLANGGHYSGTTTKTLTITNSDAGDAAAYRCVVTNSIGTAISNAAILTVQTAPVVFIVESRTGGQNFNSYSETGIWNDSVAKSTAGDCTAGIGSRYCTIGATAATAVFSFTPPVTNTYEVFTTNGNTDNSGNPLIHVVNHAGGSNNVSVCQNSSCANNAINKWYSLGQFTLNGGSKYTVTVNGSTSAGSSPSGNAGRTDAIKWQSVGSVTPLPPTITQQPLSQTVPPGGIATFIVAATGEGTLSYQWRKNDIPLNDGGHYSGTTTTTLTISNTDSGDAASYRCAVTNAGGTTISNEAALTISQPGIPGDYDLDGDVDQGDYALIQSCLSGAGIQQNDPACISARLDSDLDVDGDDIMIFRNCMSGAGVPGNAQCANP